LKSEGIKVETTCPYTPQQNGCAERKNRYLTEMIRSLLIGASLSHKYWGEALMTANHLQNRMPTGGDKLTPYEKWTGRKPKLDYLRQFGATAYVMKPNEKRHKLEEKARKLVFVAYQPGTKGYRLLDTATDKIYISRDVIFIERNPHTTSDKADEQQLEPTSNVNNSEEDVGTPVEATTTEQTEQKGSSQDLQNNCEAITGSQRVNRLKD
jgi:hypothetical protein